MNLAHKVAHNFPAGPGVLLSSGSFLLSSCLLLTPAIYAQDPPPSPEPEAAQEAAPTNEQRPNTGWRKFGEQRESDRFAPSQLILPAGAFLTIRVNQPLSSDTNQPGDTFTATLSQPLIADGFVIARRGQTVAGRVAEAQKAGRRKGTSRLGLELSELSLVDGRQIPVVTQLMEYTGGTSKGRDATAIAGTTALGAAIGGAVARRLSFGQAIIGSVAVQAACMPLFLVAGGPWGLGLVYGMIMLLAPVYNVVQFSYRIALIPDGLQGRVNSSFRLIAFLLTPVGATLCGSLLEHFGSSATVAVFAAFYVALALAAGLNPAVRHAAKLPAQA